MKMKQISFKITIFFALIVALLGCAKENAIHNGAHQGTEFTLRLVQTKTVNDGYATEWVKGDRVNVFHAEAGTSDFICDGPFEFTGEDSFTGFIREDALVNGKKYDWYVLYPYDENMVSPKAAPIHISPDQYQSEDGNMSHLAGSNCPLAGKAASVATNSAIVVKMRHLTTVLKIKVTNYEANPMDLRLVSFRADGAVHLEEEVNVTNGDLSTITGSFEVDITGDKLVYNHVNKGMGSGSSRPLLHLQTSKTLGLNESATVFLATVPFHIPNASTLTIGMNKNSDGVTQGIYGREVTFKAGQICAVRQGSRIAPPFKDGINFYHGKKNANGTYEFQDGWWRCDLPADFQFSGEFSFADLFYSFNVGDAKFELHSIGNQNDKAGNGEVKDEAKFNELAACCKGYTWVRNKRFTHNFNVSYSDKSGLFFHCYAGYNVGAWEIWFRLEDPFEDLIKDVDGDRLLATTPTINGYDLWGDKYFAPLPKYEGISANTQLNICEFYASNPSSLNNHEGASTQAKYDLFYANWANWYIMSALGEKLIWNTGSNIQMSDYASKFCQQSKGVYWQPAWFRLFDRTANNGAGGYVNQEAAWDGGQMAAGHGLSITSDGKMVVASNYDGCAFDFSPSLAFEYDYGYAQHVGTKYLPFICVR